MRAVMNTSVSTPPDIGARRDSIASVRAARRIRKLADGDRSAASSPTGGSAGDSVATGSVARDFRRRNVAALSRVRGRGNAALARAFDPSKLVLPLLASPRDRRSAFLGGRRAGFAGGAPRDGHAGGLPVRTAVSPVDRRHGAREALLVRCHRILELQAAALASERSALRGEGCVVEVCESAGCVRRDAEWAVARLESPRRTHALDDAVTQAREEGFEIPHAATELQAFSRLRRFVLRHRIFRRKPGRPRGKRRGSRKETATDANSRWVRRGPPPGIGIGKAFLVDPPL
jgi:hypothetical protein